MKINITVDNQVASYSTFDIKFKGIVEDRFKVYF